MLKQENTTAFANEVTEAINRQRDSLRSLSMSMVEKAISKVVDVIRNTPSWEIDITGYTVRPLEDRGHTEVEVSAKVCGENHYLYVLFKNKTNHIAFVGFPCVGPVPTLHTVIDYPERSACPFVAALLARALECRYYNTMGNYIKITGEQGVFSFSQHTLHSDLSSPSVETWVYSCRWRRQDAFLTLHFDINVRPNDYEIIAYYHPNGLHNYTDAVPYKTNIRGAFTFITQIISLYSL
jgi:hypothetical protein